MKVAKPVKVPILHRVIEVGRRPTFHVAAMLGFPMGKSRALLDEMAFWALVQGELGEIGVVDEGVSKAAAELLVAGSFHAPGGAPLAASYVRASVGPVDKRVAVVGDRYWNGNTPTEPKPFRAMPIDWAHAFGGPKFDRNPHGKGTEPVEVDGTPLVPLPNVETYGALLRSPNERPEPAGLTSLDVTFMQRRKRAGTYDKRWLDEHFPGMAPDMDPGFFNLGQPDQWAKTFFRGDEAFFVENMHPAHARLEGHLPGLVTRSFVAMRTSEPGVLVEIPMRCDTVWLFPNAASAVVVFHGSIPIRSDDAGDVAELVVGCEELDAPRKSVADYQAALARRRDKDRGALASLSDSDLMPPKTSGVAPNLDAKDLTRWVKSERIASKNARRGYERRVTAARTRMEEVGLDAKALELPPEEEPIPEDPDDLKDYIEKAQTESKQQSAEAKAAYDKNREKLLERAREVFKANGADFDEMTKQGAKDAAGPPKFSAQGHIDRLTEVAKRARAAGIGDPAIDAQLADPAFRRQLEQQEAGMREMYRRSAHSRPAASGMEPDASARTRLLIEIAREAGESLARRDFTGADLSGLSLKDLDLTECFMEGTNLSGCNLGGAKLDKAVLARANLENARLEGAHLAGANLGAALLIDANLDGADLSGAILSDADLRGASFADADLSGADWFGAVFGDNDFSRVNLVQATFIKVKLSSAHFPGANLSRANLIECEIEGCDFSGAKLEKTSFFACTGSGVSFAKASLRGAIFVHGSSLPGADFTEADMEKACLRTTVLAGAKLDRANLTSADLSECDLTKATFDQAVLRKAMLIRAKLDGASLKGANLIDALVSKSHVAGADFTGSNLFRADLSRVVGDKDTTFQDAVVTQVRFLPKADPPDVPKTGKDG